MSESQVSIKVPEELIRGLVVAEIAAAMTKSGGSQRMFEELVRHALDRKENHYDRENAFEKQLRGMIDEVAREVMKEWLAQNKAAIKAAFQRALEKNKKNVLIKLVDQITTGLTWISPNVTLGLERPPE